MDDEQYDIARPAGRSDRPPALLILIGIGERYRPRVAENKFSDLERHLVITPMMRFFSSSQTQRKTAPRCDYKSGVTK
jgi:hypothetical protein